jgi:putative sigma-54 modulation protein
VDLQFTFRNIEPTDAIKTWAQKRFQKVVKHLRDSDNAKVHVTMAVDKHLHQAELSVHSDGHHFHASERSDDLYSSLDGVMAKVEEQAQRTKERERSHER